MSDEIEIGDTVLVKEVNVFGVCASGFSVGGRVLVDCSDGYTKEFHKSQLALFKKAVKASQSKCPTQSPKKSVKIAGFGPDMEIVALCSGRKQSIEESQSAKPELKKKSVYHMTIKGQQIDVYDVLQGFGVTCPAMQHAIKKALMPGLRGVKSPEQDKREAINSIERSIELAKRIEK